MLRLILFAALGAAAFLLERRLIALALERTEGDSTGVSRPPEGAVVLTDGSQLRDEHSITN